MDSNRKVLKDLIPVVILTSLLLLQACISGSKDSSPLPEKSRSQIQYENDEQALIQWQKFLGNKEYGKVHREVESFIRSNPTSKHWFGIMFTWGMANEGLEDWNSALQIYQQIIDRSTDQQWEFVALAFYRRAYCYEVALDNEKAIASLADAAKLNSYLPIEITMAEIPARLASVYARLNQNSWADFYTKKAEQGMMKVRAIKKNADPEWMGRTLLKMGSVSLTQIDESSFKQNIQTLIRNQRYLIQAIELSHPYWSREGEKVLLTIYSNLWNFIENYKINPSDDWQLDLVSEAHQRSEYLSLYLESIEKLKEYESPSETRAFLKTALVYNQIKNIEKQAVALLNQELLKRPWNIENQRIPSSTEDVRNHFNAKSNRENLIDQDLGIIKLPKKKSR